MTLMQVLAPVIAVIATALIYELTDMRLFDRPARRDPSVASAASCVPAPAAAAVPVAARTSPPIRRPSPGDRELGALQAETEALRERVASAESLVEDAWGKEMPWPADIPEGYRRPAFEQHLATFVSARGLGHVVEIDCAEYPCIAILQQQDAGAPGGEALRDSLLEMTRQYYPGQVRLSMWTSQHGDGAEAVTFTAIGLLPVASDESIRLRAAHRARLGLEQHSPEE